MKPQQHHEQLLLFMRQIDEALFYDAHESLEMIWFPRRFEDDREMKLLKGFINAAVSFELIKRGRPGPSQRAWQNYLKYRPLLGEIESEHAPTYEKMAMQIEQLRSEHE